MAILPVGIGPQEGGYQIEQSLRFNSADSAYLSRTFTTPTNQQIWTFSAWVKLGLLSNDNMVFGGTTTNAQLYFSSGGALRFEDNNSAVAYTTAVYRDPSAWYHVLLAINTGASGTNKVRLYVNGIEVTSFTTDNRSTYTTSYFNRALAHTIGKASSQSLYMNGYLTEVNFIDGQALDPTSFGEYNSDTGVWQPIAYAGTYGTNGFYLPMTQDQIVEGFNTVLWRGNGGTQRITSVGFAPDLVWMKERTSTSFHGLADTVRGAGKLLYSNATDAEDTGSAWLTSFDADGFTVGVNNGTNESGQNYVGWCWDAGNSTVSNTDGTITSTVRASQTYGFSVVTYSGGSTGAQTAGHGLGTTPSMVIYKNRSSALDWIVYHSGCTSGNALRLNTGDAQGTSAYDRFGSNPTSTTIGLTTASGFDNCYSSSSGQSFVAYCFAETGYSKFGSYTGNGSTTGPTVTLGWKPSMILVKRTDSTSDWRIWDTTRTTTNPMSSVLYPNASDAEYTASTQNVDALADGFQIKNSSASMNASGGTYIYAAFKDQREAAFWRDFSGNGNHWQPNNLDFNDSVVDVPTNYGTDTGVGAEVRGNYATLNPLWKGSGAVLTNGNLDNTPTTAVSAALSTIPVSSGKFYAEISHTVSNTGALGMFFTANNLTAPSFGVGTTTQTGLWEWYDNGAGVYATSDGGAFSGSFMSTTFRTAGTFQFALDADNGKFWFGKNNVWYDSSGGTTGNPATGANPTFTISTTRGPFNFGIGQNTGYVTMSFNAGQRPFAYTAPSGFKALCTQNLPDPTIADGGNYFNAVLYTGTGTTNAVTGVGFQPDLIWLKNRNYGAGTNHVLVDVIRGASLGLASNLTNADFSTTGNFTSINADGFTVAGTAHDYNFSTDTFVAWNWKANGTGVSNTAGTITSTVSANTTAGFSIVTYTGTGAGSATVGHGLGVAPSFVIVKQRDAGGALYAWNSYHKSLGGGAYVQLNTTSAAVSDIYLWSNTAPSSTVITLGSSTGSYNQVNNYSGCRYVAYCFAPVEGYSAFGSYTGNGSADGPFVYTGFRPRFWMTKRTDTTSSWLIVDSERNTYNVVDKYLVPNSSAAENTATIVDFTSNGVKFRGTTHNDSGGTFIYAAFAENPFKYSLAR